MVSEYLTSWIYSDFLPDTSAYKTVNHLVGGSSPSRFLDS